MYSLVFIAQNLGTVAPATRAYFLLGLASMGLAIAQLLGLARRPRLAPSLACAGGESDLRPLDPRIFAPRPELARVKAAELSLLRPMEPDQAERLYRDVEQVWLSTKDELACVRAFQVLCGLSRNFPTLLSQP